MRRPHALAFVIVSLAAALAAQPRSARGDDAPAADLAAKVADLEGRVAKDAAAKDDAALARDAEAALAMSDGVSDPTLRTRLVAALGKVLAASHEEAAERPSIRALGRLGDPAGFAHLRRFMQVPTREALDAAVKMRSAAAAPVFLAIVDRTPDTQLAIDTMHVLGEFGGNDAVRERIVADLVASLRRDRPAGRYRRPRREHYGVLIDVMTDTLNHLTGQRVESGEGWFDLAEKHKADLGALFGPKSEAVTVPVAKPSPDVVAKVEALEKTAITHSSAKSDADVVASAAALASQTTDPVMRARLADVVGAILDRASDEALDRAAVKALGEIGDPKSFRFLRSRLSAWETDSLRVDAVEAAAAVRSPESVPVLFALMERAERPLCIAAARALTTFRRDPGVRETVVLGIVDTAQAVRAQPVKAVFKERYSAPTPPAAAAAVARPPPFIPWPEEEHLGRWQTVETEMVHGLNAMTGRDLPNSGAWFDLVAEHRTKPTELFLEKK